MTDFYGLGSYKAKRVVFAGEITEVSNAGCHVKASSGDIVFIKYADVVEGDPYQGTVGDYWVIYPARKIVGQTDYHSTFRPDQFFEAFGR